MLKEWLESRKFRREMKDISDERKEFKARRLAALQAVQFMDAETPEQMIRNAEAVRKYVEGDEE